MLSELLHKDIELLLFLNGLGTTNWDGFWLFITNKFSAIPIYIFILYFLFKKFGLKSTLIILLFTIILIAISDQTSNLFKFGFKRLRPCYEDSLKDLVRLVKTSCGGKYSFFSAHASNSAAVAIFFGSLLKPYLKSLKILLLIWAILVAYSRVYIGVHFPSDVIFGMFFGFGLGYLFYILTTKFLKKIT